MRLAWYGDYRLGVISNNLIYDVSDVLEHIRNPAYPGPLTGDPLIERLQELKQRLKEACKEGRELDDVRFLSPVLRPTKIIGVPVNYRKHVEEAANAVDVFTDRYKGALEEQGLFLKANSALVGCSEGIRVHFPARRTDHEMELAVVIGSTAKDVDVASALDHVAGYCIGLDMVVRGPEDRSMRKSIDSYAVLGPWLVTPDEIKDPQNLEFSLHVNGEFRQASNTKHMIMTIAEQIAWASKFYTLYPGDIIMTGTPEGVGQVNPGDIIECQIEQVGSMTVNVQ